MLVCHLFADHVQVTGQTERFMSSIRTVPLLSYGRDEFKSFKTSEFIAAGKPAHMIIKSVGRRWGVLLREFLQEDNEGTAENRLLKFAKFQDF